MSPRKRLCQFTPESYCGGKKIASTLVFRHVPQLPPCWQKKGARGSQLRAQRGHLTAQFQHTKETNNPICSPSDQQVAIVVEGCAVNSNGLRLQGELQLEGKVCINAEKQSWGRWGADLQRREERWYLVARTPPVWSPTPHMTTDFKVGSCILLWH